MFGVPVSSAVLTNPLPGLRPFSQSVECSRFVLLPECPGNSESWFLARCFRALLSDGVRGVVSFADPVPRQTASGVLVMPGHVGTIYAAYAGADMSVIA
ncbi:Mom family adenine methylcarbamoylation protein [Streptomyces mirabilis]|uniref:Mom family adenine methylcarbamoylation protein n=1 Tax=Streptomyces mirabilis TaxID=68239 RepID=UPI00366051FC